MHQIVDVIYGKYVNRHICHISLQLLIIESLRCFSKITCSDKPIFAYNIQGSVENDQHQKMINMVNSENDQHI